jgi:predicted MFS family arabinose efflux permease
MYPGFSIGAALGSFILTQGSVADLGWVGELCVIGSLILFRVKKAKTQALM